MSSRYKTKSKTSKKSILSKDVRVMIKFGWNGQRVPVNNKMTIKSTLMAVIESIQTQIPSVIFEGFGMELVAKNPDMTKEPTLLHMRNCIQRSDWNTATLEDVGVEAGSGSALLTLNLGGVDVPNATIVSSSKNVHGAEMNTKMPAKKSKESSFRTTPAPSVEIEQHPPLSTPIVASDDITKNIPVQTKNLTCEESLTKLITSHFDSDSQDCIKTLMKVIDNIIHKPGQPKTRSIRLQNQAFWNKVGSKKGGVEFLLACGFTPTSPTPLLSSQTISNKNNITLELKPEKESTTKLFTARKILQKFALNLGLTQDDIPALRKPESKPTISSSSTTTISSNTPSFDPFKPHSYNVQAASVGAPNPNKIAPDGSSNYMSQTERELSKLNQKAKNMELDMQRKPLDREWAAFLPGQTAHQPTVAATSDEGIDRGKSKGDGALLAQRMKRMNEERKKREEGGFTTKAMRDLERMKKAKLFTHAQLRICFPDGMSISANFYPNEKIQKVQKLISEQALLSKDLLFDLYVTPPRRILPLQKTLVEEDLLPAARVFVSWKKGNLPSPGVPYIKPELFSSSIVTSFPDSKKVNDNDDRKQNGGSLNKKKKSNESGSGKKKMSEEELMKRMMGGAGGFLSKKKNSSGEKKNSSKGTKPSWFKK